jgi:hypothetical protein
MAILQVSVRDLLFALSRPRLSIPLAKVVGRCRAAVCEPHLAQKIDALADLL